MGNRFHTAAGIAHQFSAEKGKDLSHRTVSRHLRLWTESPLCSDQTPH